MLLAVTFLERSNSRKFLAIASYARKHCQLIYWKEKKYGIFEALTASSRASISSTDILAQAATRFSPRAQSAAISFARAIMAWSIPFIAAQL